MQYSRMPVNYEHHLIMNIGVFHHPEVLVQEHQESPHQKHSICSQVLVQEYKLSHIPILYTR
jgi:hypothetical protein